MTATWPPAVEADWSGWAEVGQRLDGWRLTRFGPDGLTANRGVRRIIVTDADHGDDVLWRHASVSRTDKMPTYADLCLLHTSAFGRGHAYQVFVPPDEHIDIHPRCLHLWGRVDGARVLPDFPQGWGTV